MITTFFLTIIYYTVRVLISPIFLLSDVSLTDGLGGQITEATHYVANVNQFFPLSTLFSVLAIIIGIEVVIASYKVIMWVIRRIPTQS